jgi:hypothetical protein
MANSACARGFSAGLLGVGASREAGNNDATTRIEHFAPPASLDFKTHFWVGGGF